MSAPEEIHNETQSQEPTVDQPMDVAAAVGQLRVLVCGLGGGLLLVSLVLSAFVFKQNRDLAAATNNRQRQIAQLQMNQRPIANVLGELAKYSMGKPELMALFAKHGLQFSPTTAAGQPAPLPIH